MKREERRVRLARRQVLLAEVSQRAAMRGLADALVEEGRSATLAERSRKLTQTYGGRLQASDGATLERTARFAGALAAITQDAQAALADVEQQTQWQAETLSQAQTRARRNAERLNEAVAAYQAARERRANEALLVGSRPARRFDSAGLARPVHHSSLPETSAE